MKQAREGSLLQVYTDKNKILPFKQSFNGDIFLEQEYDSPSEVLLVPFFEYFGASSKMGTGIEGSYQDCARGGAQYFGQLKHWSAFVGNEISC